MVKLQTVLGWFFGALLFTALAACSSMPKQITTPHVELGSLRIEDPSLTAATFVFGLRVDNPNPFGLKVDHLNYALAIKDKELASGQVANAAPIKASGHSTVEVPVRIGYFTLFRSLGELAKDRTLPYRLNGTVEVSGQKVPFSFDGSAVIPFPDTSKVMGE